MDALRKRSLTRLQQGIVPEPSRFSRKWSGLGERAVPRMMTARVFLPSSQRTTGRNNMCLEMRDAPDFILTGMSSWNLRPSENKKGARCQPLSTGLGNLDPEAVLRPSQSRPWKRAGHNMDWQPLYLNQTTSFEGPKFVLRYKELFTLYDVMSIGLCRTIQVRR